MLPFYHHHFSKCTIHYFSLQPHVCTAIITVNFRTFRSSEKKLHMLLPVFVCLCSSRSFGLFLDITSLERLSASVSFYFSLVATYRITWLHFLQSTHPLVLQAALAGLYVHFLSSLLEQKLQVSQIILLLFIMCTVPVTMLGAQQGCNNIC